MADTAKSSPLDILKNRKENVSNFLEQIDPESFDAYMIRDSLAKIESSIQKEVEKQVQQEKKAKEKLENPEKALLLGLYDLLDRNGAILQKEKEVLDAQKELSEAGVFSRLKGTKSALEQFEQLSSTEQAEIINELREVVRVSSMNPMELLLQQGVSDHTAMSIMEKMHTDRRTHFFGMMDMEEDDGWRPSGGFGSSFGSNKPKKTYSCATVRNGEVIRGKERLNILFSSKSPSITVEKWSIENEIKKGWKQFLINRGDREQPTEESEKYRSLFNAVYCGDCEKVRELCDGKSNDFCLINCSGWDDWTPLDLAIHCGNPEMIALVGELLVSQYTPIMTKIDRPKQAVISNHALVMGDLSEHVTRKVIDMNFDASHLISQSDPLIPFSSSVKKCKTFGSNKRDKNILTNAMEKGIEVLHVTLETMKRIEMESREKAKACNVELKDFSTPKTELLLTTFKKSVELDNVEALRELIRFGFCGLQVLREEDVDMGSYDYEL